VPIIGGMGLSFVVSIVLARWLGAAEFGTYSFAWSGVVVVGTASVFGLDNTIISQLPISAAKGAWSRLRGLLRWANAVTLLASMALVGLAFLARSLLVRAGEPVLSPLWLSAGLLVPLIALLRIQQAALRSLHRTALGLLPDSVLIPFFMLGLLGSPSGRDGSRRQPSVRCLARERPRGLHCLLPPGSCSARFPTPRGRSSLTSSTAPG
jgi:O-antigen/teichoic acid export membrane protein